MLLDDFLEEGLREDSLPPPAASQQAASPVPPLLLLAPALQQCGGTETDSEAPPGGRDGAAPQAGLVLLPLLLTIKSSDLQNQISTLFFVKNVAGEMKYVNTV